MQQQGLIFIIFMLIVFPVMFLSANHNAFYIILAFILMISSIRRIYLTLFNISPSSDSETDEVTDEMEDLLNIDVRKFGAGISVVKNLIIILFYIYCTVYVYTFWLKVLAAVVILFWIYDTVHKVDSANTCSEDAVDDSSYKYVFATLINIFTIVLIATVTYNKFFKL